MNALRLVLRSLWFYRRTNLAVMGGAAVASAVLIGALAVGDSLRGSLRQAALQRLGGVRSVLSESDGFFRASLADELAAETRHQTAPVILTSGSIQRVDRLGRVNAVRVIGVDDRFWGLFPAPPMLDPNSQGYVVLNGPLAARLGAATGQEIVLRLAKPGAMPVDAPLAEGLGSAVILPARVVAVAGPRQFGRFSLRAGRGWPLNVYVPLSWLSRQIGRPGGANALLTADEGPAAQAALERGFALEDAELEIHDPNNGRWIELGSRRVFLQPALDNLLRDLPGAVGVLTYFVNDLRVGGRHTPYSTVAAMGPLDANAAARREPTSQPDLFGADPNRPAMPPVRDDEIRLTEWLADDLAAQAGDELEMTYFVPGPQGELAEATSRFRVAGAPLPMDALDRDLMPDYPGLAEVSDCRDWDPGVPIDKDRIRKKDEEYWDRYRGTPKGVISMASARRIWANRFGDLTAIRVPAGTQAAAEIHRRLDGRLAGALGLRFQPLRAEALAAAEGAVEFGLLFTGLSLFLVAAGLLLMGMLFALSVQQRAAEAGTLRAVGFTAPRVGRLTLAEGLFLAAGGVALGAGGAVAYAKGVLWGLATLWPAAAGGVDLSLHVGTGSLAGGAIAGLLAAAGAMALVVWRGGRAPVRELLSPGRAGQQASLLSRTARRLAWVLCAALLVGSVAIVGLVGAGRGPEAAGAFFGAGAMILLAMMCLCYALLGGPGARWARPATSLAALGVRSASRKRGRSLAVVAMLACGVFLVTAVGANRGSVLSDPRQRSSGTGGFAFFAQTARPLAGDLAGKGPGGKRWRLGEIPGASCVPIRLREGDEASCLNPNRPQAPEIWGVDPSLLASRRAFTFAGLAPVAPAEEGWGVLDRPDGNGPVPAVVDQNTLDWSLRMGLGQTLSVMDERGRRVPVRLAASVAGSILQGAVVISEKDFLRLFPSAGGYRVFLIDCPAGRESQTAKELASQRFLQDAGWELEPTWRRLAEFNAIEITYISMFQVLGGLGVILGSAGLGLVVFRNVLERRAELAAFRAMGFTRAAVRRMVMWEHGGLLAAGVICGVLAALVAASPSLRAAGAAVPWAGLALTVLAVTASGGLWTYLAASLALRGSLVEAMRNE